MNAVCIRIQHVSGRVTSPGQRGHDFTLHSQRFIKGKWSILGRLCSSVGPASEWNGVSLDIRINTGNVETGRTRWFFCFELALIFGYKAGFFFFSVMLYQNKEELLCEHRINTSSFNFAHLFEMHKYRIDMPNISRSKSYVSRRQVCGLFRI